MKYEEAEDFVGDLGCDCRPAQGDPRSIELFRSTVDGIKIWDRVPMTRAAIAEWWRSPPQD